MPAGTQVSIKIVPSKQDGCLYLTLRAANEARIKAVVVFAERVFEGESFAVHGRGD